MLEKATMSETIETLQAQLTRTQQSLQASEARFRNIIEKNADGIVVVGRDGRVRFVNSAAEAILRRKYVDLLGEMFGFPLVVGDTTELDIVCESGPVVVEMRVTESEWEGEPVFLASLRDITIHQQTKADLAWEAGVNAILADLSSALILSISLDEISMKVLEYAKQLTASRFGYVGYIDPPTGHLICPTMTRDIWDVCEVPEKRNVFEEFGGLWGWVLENRQSMLINDPAHDARSTGTPMGHFPIESFLSAPAMVDGRLVGQIALANSTRVYTEQDLLLVERLATIYALTVQRKQADEALRFQSQLLSNVRESVVATDLDGRITYWGHGAETLYGYWAEEVLGRYIADIIVPGAPDEELERIRRVREEGAWSGEYVQTRKDGTTFWSDTSIALVRDEHGQPAGMIGIDHDITGRKQAQESLQQALEDTQQHEKEVSALLEGSQAVLNYQEFEPAARAIFDACKELIGATSGYVALLTSDGAENEVLFLDAGGRPCTVDPELPMPIRGLREEAYRTGRPVYHNDFAGSKWANLMPEGHVTLDNVLFAPLVLGGRTVGLIGLANKPGGFTQNDAFMAAAFGELAAVALRNSRTMESLRESEEKFRRVILQSHDGISLVDEQGIVVEWNHAMEQIVGLPAEAIIGQPAWKAQIQQFGTGAETPEQVEQLKAAMLEAIQSGRAPWFGQVFEREYRRPDGTACFIQGVIFPIKTERGFMLGNIARDVTERREAEEQIKAALHEKEILLQEIHHRVKNNLTIVASLLDLQADLIDDESVRQMFQVSQDRIISMARIHEQLYQTENLANIDMAEYIQNLADHLAASYGRYDVALSVAVADIALDIRSAIPCGLIINELVTNALKYAFPDEHRQAEEKEITVGLSANHNSELALIIEDNGVGLPPDLDWQNAPSLGLQLVKLFAEQLQGELAVENQQGTRFIITFTP